MKIRTLAGFCLVTLVVLVILDGSSADLEFDADGNLLDDGLAELLKRPKGAKLKTTFPIVDDKPEAEKVVQRDRKDILPEAESREEEKISATNEAVQQEPDKKAVAADDADDDDDNNKADNGWMKVENSMDELSPAEAVKQSKFGIDLLQGSQKNGPEKNSKAPKAEGSESSQPTTTPPPATTTTGKAAKGAEETPKAPEVTTKQPGKDLKEDPQAKDEAGKAEAGKAEAGKAGDGKAAAGTTTAGPGDLEEEENSAEEDDEPAMDTTTSTPAPAEASEAPPNIGQQIQSKHPPKVKISRKIKVTKAPKIRKVVKVKKADVTKKAGAETDAKTTASPASQAVKDSSQQTQQPAAADDANQPVMEATIISGNFQPDPRHNPTADLAKEDSVPDMDATILDGDLSEKPRPNSKDHLGILNSGVGNATNANKTLKTDDVIYYPWESLLCVDDDPEACQPFKPFCPIMEVIAFRKCRKTCGLCKQDRPKNKVLVADFPVLEGHLTLTQSCPTAPVFLTACFSKAISETMKKNIKTYSLIIHSYGEIANMGATCQNFGPHFNPHGTAHGDPMDPTKHAGDLGNLDFGPIPDDWPAGVMTCSERDFGAYAMMDHLTLFGVNSPEKLPVVLYSGNPPYMEFSSKDAVSCGRLMVKQSPTGHQIFTVPIPEPGKPILHPAEPTAPDTNGTKLPPNLVAMKTLAEKLEPVKPRREDNRGLNRELSMDDLMSERVALGPDPEPEFEPEPPRRHKISDFDAPPKAKSDGTDAQRTVREKPKRRRRHRKENSR